MPGARGTAEHDPTRASALRILYVGPLWGTCQQRAAALEELGHRLVRVEAEPPRVKLWQRLLRSASNALDRPADFVQANRRMREAAAQSPFDVVWVDKGRTVRPSTLAAIRTLQPGALFVSYSPDDQMNRSNQSAFWRASVGIYDLHVTTKSYNVAELEALGARGVVFIDNAYDPATHRPVMLDAAERELYATEAGFVGGYEEDRARHMERLAHEGVQVKVWGYGWRRWGASAPALVVHDRWLGDEEYPKSVAATLINLGFLRKVNRDLQTTRTMEIPACGGFLLAERTDEHLRLFEEGREAEFFSSYEELSAKCRHYLAHPDEREKIAAAGRQRCLTSGYSNAGQLSRVLERVRALLDERRSAQRA